VYTPITRISISSMPSFVRAVDLCHEGFSSNVFQREIKVIKIAYSRLQGRCSVKIAFSKWPGLMTCRAGNKNSATTGERGRGRERDGGSVIYYPPGPAAATICNDPHPSPLSLAFYGSLFPGVGDVRGTPSNVRYRFIYDNSSGASGANGVFRWAWLGSLSAIST
jgi:hypothetical protein